MEHVITKHVLNHLESNSLLYDLQHGFRHSALCGLMFSSSFRMPGVVMVSGGISGCGLTPLLGMLSIDSVVNTDLN
jgi:hypothetical protein